MEIQAFVAVPPTAKVVAALVGALHVEVVMAPAFAVLMMCMRTPPAVLLAGFNAFVAPAFAFEVAATPTIGRTERNHRRHASQYIQ